MDVETRYTSMEKLVYSFVLAARKLRPYFQAHRIEVRTTYPLRNILHKPESSVRMLSIKGQALDDFILEFDSEVDEKAIVLAEPSSQGNAFDKHLLQRFGNSKLKGMPREENGNADALEKMDSLMDSVLLGQIPLGIQEIPSIPEISARRLHYQAAKYVEYDGVLYKRGFNHPFLRCVDIEEGYYILREVHEGIYGNHLRGGSLALKVIRQGYYWPTMKEDAFKFVRACDHCQ
ncbi:uncharacterized protein LOC141719038 [Apium graveolens]|uniref:uncharacterized protein LOC141719038 n=1 Tax=Apium graveolens TaxID=4045 RepID=UPI003D7AAAE2